MTARKDAIKYLQSAIEIVNIEALTEIFNYEQLRRFHNFRGKRETNNRQRWLRWAGPERCQCQRRRAGATYCPKTEAASASIRFSMRSPLCNVSHSRVTNDNTWRGQFCSWISGASLPDLWYHSTRAPLERETKRVELPLSLHSRRGSCWTVSLKCLAVHRAWCSQRLQYQFQ